VIARAVTVALALAATSLALAAGPAGAATPPSLQARTAILVQPDTGDVVYARAPDQRRPIASTTKLMTALLTLERANLDDVDVAAPYHPLPAESVVGLRAGERLTVRDLLRALLLASANDAAETLAVDVAGSQAAFVRAMNARAAQLHLRNTHYANSIGLDQQGNYSSARDLAKLAQVLLRDRFFAHTVDLPRATLSSGAHVRRIVNRNTLVRRIPFVDGVKTGHTAQAGYVLVGAAQRDGVRMLSVVLGDPSERARDTDSIALLRYGLGRYRRAVVARRGARVASEQLKYRDGHVGLVAGATLAAVVRRGERVSTEVHTPGDLDGPLAAGARVGTMTLTVHGRVRARVPLLTAAPVAKASLARRVVSFLGEWLTIVLIVVLAVSTLQLALMRRRAMRRRRARSRRRRGTEAA
jgi:serine-type D-Ala-D-Ala carboxypeptidase (penicillin-binding protein 5/6)